MQNRALKTSVKDGVPSSHMGCLVFVHASLFMIALGCIFGPGHFMPVAPRSVRALCVKLVLLPWFMCLKAHSLQQLMYNYVLNPEEVYFLVTCVISVWPIYPVDKNRSTTGGQSGPPYLQL